MPSELAIDVPGGSSSEVEGSEQESQLEAGSSGPQSLTPEQGAHMPLRFNIGYVQKHPHVYAIFWGNEWNESSGTREKILDFYRSLSGSSYGNILTQYFDHSGYISNETALTSYTDTRVTRPPKASREDVEAEIAYSISHQPGWETTSYENQYVVFTPPGTPPLEIGCGYHGWTGSPMQVAIAYIPWSKQECRRGLEPWGAMQVSASHEWSEAATDPIPTQNYWGWAASNENGEIGDLCNTGTSSEHFEIVPGVWAAKLADDYLWAATGAECVGHDATPIRYEIATGAPSIGVHAATLNGSIEPGGYMAYYDFVFTGPEGTITIPTRVQNPGVHYGFGEVGSGFGAMPVSASTTGLKGSTTYQVRLESISALTEPAVAEEAGIPKIFAGSEVQFTTPSWRPAVITNQPTEVGAARATLNGSVNPLGTPTIYYFEYGLTSSYGSKTPEVSAGAGTSPIAVSNALTELEFGTTYHYRLVATNAEGTSYGADQSFTPGWYTQETASPEGAKATQLKGVACTSATECTAVGSYVNGSGTSLALVERWNGTKWETQSTPTPEGATRATLEDVSCVSATECLAVGNYTVGSDESAVERTLAERWNGTSWQIQSTPNPETKHVVLEGISCSAATACTAVGSYTGSARQSLAERWNGTSWAIQSVPTPTGEGKISSELKSVSCSSGTACTAVGSYTITQEETQTVTKTLAERWNGTSWQVQTTPNPEGAVKSFLSAVSCTAATECKAVGGSGSAALGERWNGTNWELQTTPAPEGATESTLEGISCSSSTACIAVGNFNTNKGETFAERALAERWNGTSWQVQAPPKPEGASKAYLSAVSCKSASECTAVGRFESASGVISSLAEAYFKVLPPSVTTSAAASITENGATLKGTVNPHGGSTKYFFEYGTTVAYGSKTAELSAGSGLNTVEVSQAVSGLGAGTVYHFRIVASNSTGTTQGEDKTFTPGWTIHSSPNPEGAKEAKLRGVGCTAANACTAAGSYKNSVGTLLTLAERWNGTSWQIQPTPTPEGANASQFEGSSCSASTECVAVGYYGTGSSDNLTEKTLAERWNGTSWQIQATPNVEATTKDYLIGVTCRASTECTAVGNYKAGAIPWALIERWNGTSWQLQTAAKPEGAKESRLKGISCPSSSECTAVGLYRNSASVNVPLAERWNGTSWAVQGVPMPESASSARLESLSCVSTTQCIAAGVYIVGTDPGTWVEKTLAERWNGTKWEILSTPNPESTKSILESLSCASATECIAVGYYKNGAGALVNLAERWNGTKWDIQMPPIVEGAKESKLAGVSCAAAAACTATGSYTNSSSVNVTLAEGY